MAISPDNKLLFIAEEYWMIETCPNLECRLAKPKIIFSSFSIFIKGRWYKPASGLKTVSNKIIKKQKNIVKVRNKISFLLILFFLIKKIINIEIRVKVFTKIPKGTKKFIISAINEKYINPKIAVSEKFFKL